MDNFDFEKRYRDANECNPFYWHPLHLPKECVEMFENLIRARINAPYTIVKERSLEPSAFMHPYGYIYSPTYMTEHKPEIEYTPVERKRPSQYEMLYELLKRDVHDLPSAPFLGISPYLGVIAIYKQPVSYKSAAMIKKLARVFDNSDLFKKMHGLESSNSRTDNQQKTKIKLHKKTKNGAVVVDEVIKDNDAMALLKIKKM